MRTKTPKQINEQQERIFRSICNQYGRTERGHKLLLAVRQTTLRYWDNIYKANGVADHRTSEDTAKCNHIWLYGATARDIYARR